MNCEKKHNLILYNKHTISVRCSQRQNITRDQPGMGFSTVFELELSDVEILSNPITYKFYRNPTQTSDTNSVSDPNFSNQNPTLPGPTRPETFLLESDMSRCVCRGSDNFASIQFGSYINIWNRKLKQFLMFLEKNDGIDGVWQQKSLKCAV